MSTSSDNEKNYTRRQVLQANKEKELIENMGYPSIKDVTFSLESGLVRNCPLNLKDVDNITHIYSTPVPILKGKSTRKVSP